jgi:L-cysteate sulfo-lyase
MTDDFIPDVPRFRLAAFPTPIDRLARLEDALRREGVSSVPRIYLKRDDLLSLALGGNKIRNLEFLIGEALADGATDVITAGRQQSNHCRLTAAACALAGLRCHVVLNGKAPERETGNLLLTRMLGARIYFTQSDDRADRESWVRMVEMTPRMFGARSYVIPVGGSDARGALGHVLLGREVLEQTEALGEKPTTIMLASATGGTQAGLVAGIRKLESQVRVLGYTVANPADELAPKIVDVANQLAASLGTGAFGRDDVDLDDAQLGGGYGVHTEAGAAAIDILARTEGIVIDPVYTGKAFAGLLDAVRSRRYASEESVVFIHTGGTPALFA